MLQDRYGLPVSTASAAACEAYVEGVDRILSASAGAEESFDRAIAADPGLALAHIGRARSLQLRGLGAQAQAGAARARGLVAAASRRERQHVEVLTLAIEGQATRALEAIRAHLGEFPRDAMVLAPATGVYGLIGFSGRRDRNEELLALLDGLEGQYGDDWWFLGAHGFAHTEVGRWKAGLERVERSLALCPRNAHAAHARAHIFYERGEDTAGGAFVADWLAPYPRAAQLHCHLSWHLALFELAQGRTGHVWALYTDSIGPGASQAPPMPTLADSASLLWRSELSGEACRGEHWQQVARYALEAFPRAGLTFADAHCALAFAAAGHTGEVERLVQQLSNADAEGRLAVGSVAPAVAQAFGAFASGRYDETIRLLAPVNEDLVRVGGSRAQRDLFEHTLVAAYLRSGRLDEARALLERRLDRRPSVPVQGL